MQKSSDTSDFHYHNKPIGCVISLARTLGVSVDYLLELLSRANNLYKVSNKIVKPDGSIRVTYKVLEPLKDIQLKIKNRILDKVSLPSYIMAGRSGSSSINNAKLHLSTEMIVAEDIKNFFPSISLDYVERVFKYLFKFPQDVSGILGRLCTLEGFLVQGSPVSGSIANLVFFDREPGLVKKLESHGITYSRYYDDIHLSSRTSPFHDLVGEIRTSLYGMFKSVELVQHTSPKKSRVMTRSSRMSVHDITVNSHKLSPSRKRDSNVRMDIFNFRKEIENRADVEHVVNRYRSICGKIQNLKLQGSNNTKVLFQELDSALHLLDEKQVKKYIRSIRKVRNKYQYSKLRAKLSVIKRISPKLSGIINAEAKQALAKIKAKEPHKKTKRVTETSVPQHRASSGTDAETAPWASE